MEIITDYKLFLVKFMKINTFYFVQKETNLKYIYPYTILNI